MLRRAGYYGDVSALCHLPACADGPAAVLAGVAGLCACSSLLPNSRASAGCGPDLLWYALPGGALRCTAQLFEGARVHGLRVAGGRCLVAFGGRRVATFQLDRGSEGGCAAVRPAAALPSFAAWVMDVKPLRGDDEPDAASPLLSLLAVALSDNAVELWCAASCTRRWRSVCAERTLLYSAALFGDSQDQLRAASGAIFNHVLLWRPAPPARDGDEVRPAARLQGHEGAIHRLAWDDAGALLCSVSEDRSARLWDTRNAWGPCDAPRTLQPAASLFGHTGRVWDVAFVDDDMLATVAEDSTARLWRRDGTQLAAIQGHRGRGIWRCAAAGGSLATGGADGGVKLWRLADWLSRDSEDAAEHSSAGGTDTVVCAEPLDVAADGPRTRGKDFCRCVAAVSPTLLLYASNTGIVRAADLSAPEAPRWSAELFSTDGAAIMCLRVAPAEACPADIVARALVGDMAGYASVLDVHRDVDAAGAALYAGRVLARWLAHDHGRTLAAFWLHTADGYLPATADAVGALKVWRLDGAEARELARVQLKCRVSSAAAQPQADARASTVLCGDQRGGVFAFGLPRDGGELISIGSVAHAHATSIITFAGCTAHDAVTAGSDGYVCSFAALPGGGLARTRRLHVAAITAVEALQDDDSAVVGSTCIAAGVTSGDAIVMDLRNACELLRIPCGGWRKPHAFLLGPAGRFVFACVRDGGVHVHRRWPEGVQGAGGPDAHRSLRASHHGREVHAAVFVPGPDQAESKCALITGAEDGTLFHLYVVAENAPAVDGAALMAQTTGGTAVRALSLLRDASDGWLLVSAGAKEVLMCWSLRWSAAGELTAQLLAAHSRPADSFHRAWRAAANMPADATGGDQRYMALCAFVVEGELFAVASSSDGTLCMWALPLAKAARWRFVAVLHSGSCPVLALECVTAADGGVWLFSGATDGTIAVWDASAAVRSALAAPAAEAPAEAPADLPELSPSLLLRHAHQSGVNCMSISRAPAALCGVTDLWLLVTGGDDQAVNAVALELTPACRVVAAVRRPGAHASGVKGIWTDGAAVHTVSLDQRVRCWRLDAAAAGAAAAGDAHLDAPWLTRLGDAELASGGRVDMQHWWSCAERKFGLALVSSIITEVPDVETLAALPRAPDAGPVLAVAGRGVQAFA